MREVIVGNKFKRDLKRAEKRGQDLKRLAEIIDMLAQEQPLPTKLRDHTFKGTFKDLKELHIAPDWLLIYEITENNEVFLIRTGTHADVFGHSH